MSIDPVLIGIIVTVIIVMSILFSFIFKHASALELRKEQFFAKLEQGNFQRRNEIKESKDEIFKLIRENAGIYSSFGSVLNKLEVNFERTGSPLVKVFEAETSWTRVNTSSSTTRSVSNWIGILIEANHHLNQIKEVSWSDTELKFRFSVVIKALFIIFCVFFGIIFVQRGPDDLQAVSREMYFPLLPIAILGTFYGLFRFLPRKRKEQTNRIMRNKNNPLKEILTEVEKFLENSGQFNLLGYQITRGQVKIILEVKESKTNDADPVDELNQICNLLVPIENLR